MIVSDPDPTAPVLAAVDFSADSRSALFWAARQAGLEDTSLLVLHVVHDPAASPGFYHVPDENWLRPMVDVAGEKMQTFLAEARSDRPDLPALAAAATRLVSGLPAGRIVEVAAEAGARLVVVGCRGLTGLSAILLGSVAERVVQTSPVPVVVVKSADEDASA